MRGLVASLSAPSRGRFNSNDIYNTDSWEPPSKPPPPKGSGNYCFRAETSYSMDGVTTMKYVGYSQNFNIADEVAEKCSRHRESFKAGECGDVKLAFIGDHPKCDGRIESEKVSDTF